MVCLPLAICSHSWATADPCYSSCGSHWDDSSPITTPLYHRFSAGFHYLSFMGRCRPLHLFTGFFLLDILRSLLTTHSLVTAKFQPFVRRPSCWSFMGRRPLILWL